MKIIFTFTAFLLLTFSLNSQSYFNSIDQNSNTISFNYSPNEAIDIYALNYIISSKGRLDITPSIRYSNTPVNEFNVKIFNVGAIADYYVIKQRSTMPISFSVGAGYSLTRASGLGTSEISHVGSARARIYHNISVNTIQVVPRIGYLFQMDIENTELNDGAFEMGAGIAKELKNSKRITLTPGLIFYDNDTQFSIELGYMF